MKIFWPVLFILGVWFVFSSPYFFQNKVPYASKYQVTFFTPWNQYQEFAGPVKNGAMPDVVNQIYPWKHFTIESLKKGQIPFWNPYSFGGTPHLANYQSAVFSPFNLLYFVLPFVDAWSVNVLFQPLLAGLFMYLFLRELKVSPIGALFSSIAFMFCGFMVVWMAYGTMAMAVAFLPLALLGIERGFAYGSRFVIPGRKPGIQLFRLALLDPRVRGDDTKRSAIIYMLLLPLSIAISFFSGHIQISFYIALYTLVYLLFKFWSTKNIKAFLWIGGFYLIGILIALIQIIPTLELYKLSVRSELVYSGGAIPFSYLPTLFAPDFYGNPVTRNDWFGYYAEWASFIGIIPLTLAIVALFAKASKTRLFFFILGIIVLLLAMESPVQKMLASSKLPIFSTSIPSRIIFLFSFSFIVLAGFGFDLFFEQIKKKSFKRVFIPFILVSLILGIVWILLFVMLPSDKTMLAARNMVLPSGLFLILAVGVASNFFIKRKKALMVFMGIVILLTVFDSLRFANKWMPFDPKDLAFPKMPVIDALLKNIGQGRVYGDFGAFVDTYYALPALNGYDPLYNKRYGEFIQSAAAGEFVSAQRSVVSLDKRGKYTDRVLDLLAVNLIYHPYSDTDKPWGYPVWEKLDKYDQIYQDEKFQVFKNKTALPRAKVFYEYEVVAGDKKLIKRFYDEKFDFRNVLILENIPNFKQSAISNQQSVNKVDIVSYTPNKIIVSVSTDKPGLLFLSDPHYPKWQVKVNGKDSKIYRADYAFRAVVVPSGTSEVEFYYKGLF